MGKLLKAVETNRAAPPGASFSSGDNLATAISKISAAVEQVGKYGRNTFHNYNYARAPDVVRALAPLMHEHGVIVTQSETACEMLTPDVMKVNFDFTVEHYASGETRIIKSSGMAKVTGDKRGFNDRAIQAIATTTRKYMLIALFSIVVDDMPDVDAQGEGKPKTLSKQQAAGTFKRLTDEVATITNLGDLQEWGENNGVTIATLPDEWQKTLRFRYTEKLTELRGPRNSRPLTVVPAPKTALQQPKTKGISQRAIDARARRIWRSMAKHADDAPFDELPDHSVPPKNPRSKPQTEVGAPTFVDLYRGE